MKIYDNVFSLEENNSLYSEIVYKRKYRFGEVDLIGLPPTGLVDDLTEDDYLHSRLYNVIIEKNKSTKGRRLQRSYINLFLANERPFFHTDGDVTTFLFYINPPTHLDEGGETQFVIDSEVINVLPRPCRLVEFDGNIMHRATSFRTLPRITVAFKFFKIGV